MNVNKLDRKPDSRAVGTGLSAIPMRIYLSGMLELTIDAGDVLDEVARAVVKHWGFTTPNARQTVALWFALGERRRHGNAQGPWRPEELDPRPNRRYDPSGRRSAASRRRRSPSRARPRRK